MLREEKEMVYQKKSRESTRARKFYRDCGLYAIKDLRSKSCYTANEDSEVICLTEEHMNKLLKFYDEDTEIRRKEYIEMFLLSFHCCGLRVVD